MTDIDLPPLPERSGVIAFIAGDDVVDVPAYTRGQMQDYARAAVLADRAARAAAPASEWPGSYDAAGNPLGPHDNKADVTVPHPMLSPTHFCKDCGAYWRQCDDFTFNLRSTKACEACDNTPVGGQLIALVERAAAPDAETAAWMICEPGCKYGPTFGTENAALSALTKAPPGSELVELVRRKA